RKRCVQQRRARATRAMRDRRPVAAATRFALAEHDYREFGTSQLYIWCEPRLGASHHAKRTSQVEMMKGANRRALLNFTRHGMIVFSGPTETIPSHPTIC